MYHKAHYIRTEYVNTMRLKHTDYIAVLLVAIAYAANVICTARNNVWYDTLTLPSLTPPGWVFSVAWQTIYALLIIALARTFRTLNAGNTRIFTLWIINGIAHVIWSPLFFCNHMVWLSFIDASIILATAWLLIWNTWRYDRISSILLIPYGVWMILALYLSAQIAILHTGM